MISRKRRLFAKVVSIIVLASTVMTSNGIVMAAETSPSQAMANNLGNEKVEKSTETSLGGHFKTENEGTNETEVSNMIVSSLVNSNVSTNIISRNPE